MSKLMELVEEYGDIMAGYSCGGKLSDGDPVLAKISAAVAELEREAARGKWCIMRLGPSDIAGLSSRKRTDGDQLEAVLDIEVARLIDAAMEADNAPAK